MAWDNEGTRAGDYGTCAPCGNTYHADDPIWAPMPDHTDPICRDCDTENNDRLDRFRKEDTDEDLLHDTAAELEAFGPAIP